MNKLLKFVIRKLSEKLPFVFEDGEENRQIIIIVNDSFIIISDNWKIKLQTSYKVNL